jgi:hypothetical protein
MEKISKTPRALLGLKPGVEFPAKIGECQMAGVECTVGGVQDQRHLKVESESDRQTGNTGIGQLRR